MAVYVDNMRARYGRMVMCHMAADRTDELLAMADKIGVSRRWLQKAGTSQEHFDICLTKRAAAVAAGAIEVTAKDLVRGMLERQKGRAT
jgi:dsDNA-binding SOS-regulon protein